MLACEPSLPEPSEPAGSAAVMFTAHLNVIRSAIASVARRNHLSADETEECTSVVYLKLIEADYAILRKFGGRSSLRTYLTAVVQRLLLDHRVTQWGKWNPSATARRGGPAAILLERLTRRDGLSLDQALTVMAGTGRDSVDVEAMTRIHGKLPLRASRRCLNETVLTDVISPLPGADAGVALAARMRTARRAVHALAGAMRHFSSDDRLILRLRFVENCKISEIARHLPGLDRQRSKALYPRLRRLLDRLGESFQRAGIDRSDLLGAIGVFDHLAVPGLFGGAPLPRSHRVGRAARQGRRTQAPASRMTSPEYLSQESSSAGLPHGADAPDSCVSLSS
jgi:RNA polymerase sigma factor (sigma-70 family)